MKKDFYLKNLNCAHCANKIDEALGKFEEIEEHKFNLLNKKLSFNLSSKGSAETVGRVKKLIQGIEAAVEIEDLSQHQEVQVELYLKNLGCAHCASKMEEEIHNLASVRDFSLSFVSKKAKFKVEKNQKRAVLDQIEVIVKAIEPEVEVEELSLKYKPLNLKFEGLNCASCSSKIEDRVKNLDEVYEGAYNFTNGTFKLELHKKVDEKLFLKKVEVIVDELEPGVVVSIKDGHRIGKELSYAEEFSKKELVCAVSGTFIFILALVFDAGKYISLTMFLTAYMLVGGDIVLKAFRKGSNLFDENFLMTIATFGAFLIGEYPEAVAVMLFYKVGEYFQERALSSSRRSIEKLMDIKPDSASIKVDGELVSVYPEEVGIGEKIYVKAGERVPLDGIIISGSSSIDSSALTGESALLDVGVGDEVLSGSINKRGLLEVEVMKPFYDSTVAKILELVENAGTRKAKTEKFISKFAKYYTPVVVALASLLALVPPMLIQGASFSDWFYRALIFLVISCPCALVISIPLAFFGGIGSASHNGILIKGSNYLEALNGVKTVVFDKTGTLTNGVFRVTKVVPVNDCSEDEISRIGAHIEKLSNHPIAKSIVESYEGPVDMSLVEDYEEVEGHGIRASFEGIKILVGNHKLMQKHGVSHKVPDELGTVVYVARGHEYLGYILISDEVKKDSKSTVENLKKLGIKSYMLTGDNESVARKIGEELGVDKIYSSLLPHEKVEYFEKIKKEQKGSVIFVGDGINDAPVLARADIGVAMGALGSDAAIEAADIVFITDELSKLNIAFKIAEKTREIVSQNIIFSLAIKLLVLSLGAAGFANMWEAVFADVGVAFIAVLNSMRVLKMKV